MVIIIGIVIQPMGKTLIGKSNGFGFEGATVKGVLCIVANQLNTSLRG
jgi:hypothetical protein